MTVTEKVKTLLEQSKDQKYGTDVVVTNQQLANAVGVAASSVRSFVCSHKEQLLKGKHYFLVTPQELRDINVPFNRFANSCTLWTEKGALLYASLKEETSSKKEKEQKVTGIPMIPTPVVWQQDLVLTTAQLAEFYETSVDNIRRNFSNNSDRFVDGKHFFKIEGNDLQRFRKIFPEALDKFAPSLFLWTKRGAARHAKMLNTDRAWEVFELLEDNYFNSNSSDNTITVKRYHEITAQITATSNAIGLNYCKLQQLKSQVIQQENLLMSLAEQRRDLFAQIHVIIPDDQQSDVIFDNDYLTLEQLFTAVQEKISSVSQLYDYCKNHDIKVTESFTRSRAKISAEDAAKVLTSLEQPELRIVS